MNTFIFSVKVSKRSASLTLNQKVQAMGIFSGARVSRGPDWDWGNQDGELNYMCFSICSWMESCIN